MNTNFPLEELILTLLALAEAAPHLDGEALTSLAALAEALADERQELDASDEASLVDLLSFIQIDIMTELFHNRAFQEAKRAWGQEAIVRVKLGVETLNQTLDVNPESQRSSGVVALTEIVEEALHKPSELAQNQTRLQQLTALIGSVWPRRGERRE